tara:strand:- start:8 stop:115 length:108 start_codon:yes stop_codon:yes gene_type:complete
MAAIEKAKVLNPRVIFAWDTFNVLRVQKKRGNDTR